MFIQCAAQFRPRGGIAVHHEGPGRSQPFNQRREFRLVSVRRESIGAQSTFQAHLSTVYRPNFFFGGVFKEVLQRTPRRLFVLISGNGNQVLATGRQLLGIKSAGPAAEHTRTGHDHARIGGLDYRSTLLFGLHAADRIVKENIVSSPNSLGQRGAQIVGIFLINPADLPNHAVHINLARRKPTVRQRRAQQQDHLLRTTDCKRRNQNLSAPLQYLPDHLNQPIRFSITAGMQPCAIGGFHHTHVRTQPRRDG